MKKWLPYYLSLILMIVLSTLLTQHVASSRQNKEFIQLIYGDKGKELQLGIKIYLSYYLNTPHFTLLFLTADSLSKLHHDAESIWWYEEALKNYPPGESPDKKIKLYNHLGIAYQKTKDYEKSLSYYYKGLELALLQTKGKEPEAACYTNIGVVHCITGDFKKCIFFYKKALNIYRRTLNHTMVANSLFGIGVSYSHLGSLDSARAYYYSAIEILENESNTPKSIEAIHTRENNFATKCRIISNISKTWLRQNMPDSALSWLHKINSFYKEIPEWFHAYIHVNYADAYGQKGDYHKAISYSLKGIEIAKRNTHKDPLIFKVIQDHHRSLSSHYCSLGLYQDAWKHERIYSDMMQSYYKTNEENIRYINNLETKYQLSEKDKELALRQLYLEQSEHKVKQRNLQIIILMVVVASVCVILIVSLRSHKHKKRLLQEQFENARKSKKIVQIGATLQGVENERERIAKELHDSVMSEVLVMKVNLKAIEKDYLVLQHSDDYKNVIEQTRDIAQRLRQVAHNLMPANLEEFGIYACVEAFIERIHTRKIQFTLQHYGRLPRLQPEVEKIILLSILELVQNVLKHAKATEALVQMNLDDDMLSITVEDNGVGIQRKTPQGIGLSNMKNNMKVLGAQMNIQSSEYTGTTILLEIPILEYILTEKGIRNEKQEYIVDKK